VRTISCGMSSFAALPETAREEALSRADLAWLHAEAPTNHFVVTSLALFDEPLNVDRFKTLLSQRIALHPLRPGRSLRPESAGRLRGGPRGQAARSRPSAVA
jgi:hypothetical protein